MSAICPAAASESRPSICFVACVESGELEAQTVRLVESLRRFGGSLAESEVLTVTSRVGPPLARTTKRRLRDLGVRHVRVRARPRYAWFHYRNKMLAVAAAERQSSADLIAFLDSDVLVLGEPNALLLDPDEDFAACVPDNCVVGTTGAGSGNEPHWQRICEHLEIEIDQLPWVNPAVGDGPIRLCFNAGIFVYRRETGFARVWLELCERALAHRLGFPVTGEVFIEQVCLGLAAMQAGLRWRCLPYSHNRTLLPSAIEEEDPGHLRDTRLLHYHGSMDPASWDGLLALLEPEHQPVSKWLRHMGPLGNPAPVGSRVAREVLRVAWGVPRRRYRRHVQLS